MTKTKRLRLVVMVLLSLKFIFVLGLVQAEDLASAVAAGKVTVMFRGRGASSGDAILATVSASQSAGSSLVLTIAPGTSLQSGSARDQNMVIAGVKGESVSTTSYRPSSVIQAGSKPQTYILEAYCMEFEKDNPSASTAFSLGRLDPVLNCILSDGAHLSTASKQAAVWMYTDKATFEEVSYKFQVSRAEWRAAEVVVAKCNNPRAVARPAIGSSPKTESEDPFALFRATSTRPAIGPLPRTNAPAAPANRTLSLEDIARNAARRVDDPPAQLNDLDQPDADNLTLRCVAITGSRKVALINEKMMHEGESVEMLVGMKRTTVRCVQITATNVTIEFPSGKRSVLYMP